MLGNTYHLMLRPGAELVAELGGLHRFTDWNGHVLTDSGGYQIFSLEPKVTDDGATFRSHLRRQHATTSRPRAAVAVQRAAGQPTSRWCSTCARRCRRRRAVHAGPRSTAPRCGPAGPGRPTPPPGRRLHQAQFGIVQGGVDLGPAHRERRAHRRASTSTATASAGCRWGSRSRRCSRRWPPPRRSCPVDQPRYLMGVGDPVSIVEAVALGVDMFDCVLPTRLARHGTILTAHGRLNLRNAKYMRDPEPLDPECACPTCARWSRAYLRHLLMVSEPTVARLTTIHNVHWLLRLMESARAAIVTGTYDAFRRSVVDVWGAPST